MNHSAETCARTNAVLAVHLDGDFTSPESSHCIRAVPGDANDDAANGGDGAADWGFAFVCGDSLREHLFGCTICQRALQRARRLDAALAAQAGHAVAESLAKHGAVPICDRDDVDHGTLDHGAPDRAPLDAMREFGRQLVHRAMLQVRGAAIAESEQMLRLTSAHKQVRAHDDGEVLVCPAKPRTDVRHVGNRVGARVAGLLLGAAVALTWWLFAVEQPPHGNVPATAREAAATPAPQAVAPALLTHDGHQQAAMAAATPAPSLTPASETASPFPLAAARRFAEARSRSTELAPEPTADELAQRVADRSTPLSWRMTAAEQLLLATRTPTRNARAATDALLQVLARCGDGDADELQLLRKVLPQLQTSTLASVLVQRLQPLLTDEPATLADLDSLAALVVASRTGGERLDASLRRVLRMRPDLDSAVTQSLRVPTRDDGGARLLLDCWQDRVGSGQQADTPEAALHWFGGMAAETFRAVHHLLENSRSAPERVRCLLALGCVDDNSTCACLLSHLRSGRQLEACAASAALSTLPHAALRPLLPLARRNGTRRGDDALLRFALCRAGLAEAAPWLSALELSEAQHRLVHVAPLTRFPEIAGWFREGQTTAD